MNWFREDGEEHFEDLGDINGESISIDTFEGNNRFSEKNGKKKIQGKSGG